MLVILLLPTNLDLLVPRFIDAPGPAPIRFAARLPRPARCYPIAVPGVEQAYHQEVWGSGGE